MDKETIILSKEDKKILLETLGYTVDKEGFVLSANKDREICPFTNNPIKLEDASIMPGSLIIMNTTPVTLSEYFYQYPDD
ncbi:hypothetical protein HYW19_01335 [Candidatus Woesearchaeota archaeon]|nr:hypothetical protein [Candidatus Woesearchaeota archaeon]